jgi:hypothetical protein
VTPSGFGEWIRPVSARPSREVSEEDRRYADGSDPSLLDIIEIPLLRPEAERHQRENHLIDADRYWKRTGKASWTALAASAEDPHGPLWLNGHSSTYGLNDRVPATDLNALTRSLFLVKPPNVTLTVAHEGGDYGPARRRVRARFTLHGEQYCLVVTDPELERNYLARPDGEFVVTNALICVSLAEDFHGFGYKLAASIIMRD